MMSSRNVSGVAPTSSPSVAPAPLSPLEVALANLWSFMLQLSSVGVQDDFFLLGGDSLRGTQLLTSVKGQFDNAATVAGMARAIEAVRAAKGTV